MARTKFALRKHKPAEYVLADHTTTARLKQYRKEARAARKEKMGGGRIHEAPKRKKKESKCVDGRMTVKSYSRACPGKK